MYDVVGNMNRHIAFKIAKSQSICKRTSGPCARCRYIMTSHKNFDGYPYVEVMELNGYSANDVRFIMLPRFRKLSWRYCELIQLIYKLIPVCQPPSWVIDFRCVAKYPKHHSRVPELENMGLGVEIILVFQFSKNIQANI